MEKRVRCFTRDGIERNSKGTVVPLNICELLHSIAQDVIKDEIELKDKKLA